MYNLEVFRKHDLFVGGEIWLVRNASFSVGCPVLTDDPYNPNLVLERSQETQYLVEGLCNMAKLTGAYVNKTTAIASEWVKDKALNNKILGALIEGDIFDNSTYILVFALERIWYETDIGSVSHMTRAKQSSTRLLYSNDGLLYVTADHYKTFDYMGNWK